MNLVQRIEDWADHHHPKWLDILRILLGLLLFGKGLYFIGDSDIIVNLLKGSSIEFISIVIAHYVALAHLIGGVMIIAGLLTRVAIAFQIPILIGAIIFVNITRGFFALNSDLPLSVIVLFLLLFFFVYGSGPISVDYYLKRHPS